MGTLYRDIEDCEQCPAFGEECQGGWTSGYGGEPIEPPCTSWDDDTDIEAWQERLQAYAQRLEDQEEAKRRKQKEREIVNAKNREKRRMERMHVFLELQEIKRLKGKISGNKAAINLAMGLAEALNFTNEAFNYSERYKANPGIAALEEKNEKYQQRIVELEQIKAQKLKEFRAARRTKEA